MHLPTRALVLFAIATGTIAAPAIAQRIVTLPARATPAQFALRTLVTAGQLDVSSAGSIAVDARGLIYVADSRDLQIVVYDSTGRRVRAFGRRGAGPGEFREIRDIALVGDTLFTLDWQQLRLSLFTLDGRFIEARPWSGALRGGGMLKLLPAGPTLLAKALIIGQRPRVATGPGSVPAEIQYFEIDGAGRAARIPGVDAQAMEPHGSDCHWGNGKIRPLDAPLANRGPLAAGTASGMLALASRDRYHVDVFDPRTGTVAVRIDRPLPQTPVSDSAWQREAAEYLALFIGGAPVRCEPPFERPPFMPVVRAMVSDPSGRLWLEVTAGNGFALHVIDPATGTLVEAAMPARDVNVVPYARGNRLYFVNADRDGVQSIQVYERR